MVMHAWVQSVYVHAATGGVGGGACVQCVSIHVVLTCGISYDCGL